MSDPRRIIYFPDDSPEGLAVSEEEAYIDLWIAAGAPDPMEMWKQLQAGADSAPERERRPLATAPDVRAQGLVSVEDACLFLGRISRDTFDRHVRRHIKQRRIGSRPYFLMDSLAQFVQTDAFKALS